MSEDQVLLEERKMSGRVRLCCSSVFSAMPAAPQPPLGFLAASQCQSQAQLWLTGPELPQPAASRCSLAH